MHVELNCIPVAETNVNQMDIFQVAGHVSLVSELDSGHDFKCAIKSSHVLLLNVVGGAQLCVDRVFCSVYVGTNGCRNILPSFSAASFYHVFWESAASF